MSERKSVPDCESNMPILADRTATQYDQLLASSRRPSVRLSVCPSVRLSVCNAVPLWWLSGSASAYRVKRCTSVFLAGKFLFVSSVLLL